MGKVTADATMSLDGYIAGPEEVGFDLLFEPDSDRDVGVSSASSYTPPARNPSTDVELIKPEWECPGAMLVGWRLYDMTNAWGGRHPMDVPTVVLTHRRPENRPEDDDNFAFVIDGIEAAVAKAKELAGGRNVVIDGGQMTRQCLKAGLLDEVNIELVPIVLGGGKPLFSGLSARPMQFHGPIAVTEGSGATHLRYRVGPGAIGRFMMPIVAESTVETTVDTIAISAFMNNPKPPDSAVDGA